MLTETFIDSLEVVRGVPLTQKLRSKLCFCLLDYVGCFFAGRRFCENQGRLMSEVGGDCAGRALWLGFLAHMIELDDGHRVGMVHPGVPVISALLAVAENHEVNFDDFLHAVLVGYEATVRLACAVQPGCKLRGYHATGTCGTIGAAMAVAALLHLDKEQTRSAFAAATTSAAGLLEMITGQSELKPYNAGRAAMDGVMAALFGRHGFLPPDDALGGKRGFLAAMTDAPKLNYLSGMPDSKFAVETIYQKPYASCRHCHAPIEAALRLADCIEDVNDVESICVETYKLAVFGHDEKIVQNSSEAKMSIPYSVAAALVRKSGGIESFSDEAIVDSRIRKIACRVQVVERSDFTNVCPAKRIARVILKLSAGKELDWQVDYPRGEPENPLLDDELQAKFIELSHVAGMNVSEAQLLSRLILNGTFCNLKDVLLKMGPKYDSTFSHRVQ